MRHIYGIWFVRKVVPTLALETAALTFVALVAQMFTTWGHIANNAIYRWTHHPLSRMDDFWIEAFRNTDIAVKFLVLAGMVAAALLVRDTVRATRNFFVPHRVSI